LSLVIVVTGTSSGFGQMTAVGLARAGHTVYACMHSLERSAGMVQEFGRIANDEGIDLRTIQMDVSDDASVDTAVAQIIADQGRLDVVVHNAGHMGFGPAEAFTAEQMAQLYDVNTISTQRLNRAVLPHMRRARSGLLVWVSSSSVKGNWSPYLGGYFAAKSGMEQLAIAYASELARWGIETSIVVPGAFTTGTEHFAHAMQPADQDRAQEYQDGPTKGLGHAILHATASLEPADADPAEVGRQIVNVIAAPPGKRPFRVTIDPSQDGSEIVSAVQDRLRQDTLGRIGLGDLLHPAQTKASRS
jgi:NAD(P)-dependent dehydrogenase (short-subunit alcohol dehydrogenase family)